MCFFSNKRKLKEIEEAIEEYLKVLKKENSELENNLFLNTDKEEIINKIKTTKNLKEKLFLCFRISTFM